VRNAYKILFEKPEGKRPLGRDLSVDGIIILRWFLSNMRVWLGLNWQ
jgi:hypothetical protein